MYSRTRRQAHHEQIVEDPAVIQRRRKQAQITMLLRRINETLTGYKGSPLTNQTAEEFRKYLRIPRRFNETMPLRSARLLGGAAVVFTSLQSLEDNSHVLLLGTAGSTATNLRRTSNSLLLA